MAAVSTPVRTADGSSIPMRRYASAGDAMRRRPVVVVLPAVVLMVLGAVLGLHGKSTYTATAQLVVQPLAPTVSQLPGAVQSAEDQATNESRLVNSSAVIVPLASEFHMTAASIANHISATPIPGSTVIRLGAEANSADAAVALANAAAVKFAHYVNRELQSTAESETVLRSYQAAEVLLNRARNTKTAFEGRHISRGGLVSLEAAVSAAQLRATALGAQYQSTIQALATAPSVKPFASATKASSSRSSKVEIYVLGGLVVGLLLGIAAATLLANRPVVRGEHSV